MQGIEVLYWALSAVFCLALLFAILLWCRSWRREEREAANHQVQLLAREVRRLSAAVEMLEQTALSLQTADEQLTRHLESLRGTVQTLKRRQSSAVESSSVAQRPPERPAERAAERPIEHPVADIADDSESRYEQARVLLRAGHDHVAVARQLDLGRAEVRMIARLLNHSDTNA